MKFNHKNINSIEDLPESPLARPCKEISIMVDKIQKDYRKLMHEGMAVPLWERNDKNGMEMLLRAVTHCNNLLPLMELFNETGSFLEMAHMSMKVASDAIEARKNKDKEDAKKKERDNS